MNNVNENVYEKFKKVIAEQNKIRQQEDSLTRRKNPPVKTARRRKSPPYQTERTRKTSTIKTTGTGETR